MPGSEPMLDDEMLLDVARETVKDIYGKGAFKQSGFLTSSTDMGDVGVLFPAIHAYAYGAKGTTHGKDYYITDPKNACVDSAVFQVCLARNLLMNNAQKAKEIIANYVPEFKSIDEFLKHKNSINKNKQTVIYNEDGTIVIDIN